jgi:hypothetical protein
MKMVLLGTERQRICLRNRVKEDISVDSRMSVSRLVFVFLVLLAFPMFAYSSVIQPNTLVGVSAQTSD